MSHDGGIEFAWLWSDKFIFLNTVRAYGGGQWYLYIKYSSMVADILLQQVIIGSLGYNLILIMQDVVLDEYFRIYFSDKTLIFTI